MPITPVPRLAESPRTFCNPLNIGYQYQAEFRSRESADPAAILFKGIYYLFASHGSGYWWSEDLADWHFVYVSEEMMPEIGKWAPGVCVLGDTMYLTHSQEGGIYRSEDPRTGKWEFVSHPLDWGDPALFTDEDGRVYCYYGCSPRDPIWGVELDPRNTMAAIGSPVALIRSDGERHGFEVRGDGHTEYGGECWLEGAWMNKYEGKYYLQYAVPGTQFLSYCDGCYVSDKPLGPFTFCNNSPVIYKAGGFMGGAGHGSLLEDKNGNWWKFNTVSISINHMFERRLIMAPAAFDSHGQLVTDTVLADYPLWRPHDPAYAFGRKRPDWFRLPPAAVTASSALPGHPAELAAEETLRTWWSAASGEAGEWLTFRLEEGACLRALQINFADQEAEPIQGRENDFRYRYTVEISSDGAEWLTLIDRSEAVGAPHTADDTSHDYFELEEDVRGIRFLRLTNRGPVPAGGRFAVSGLRLFGNGGHAAPAAPVPVRAQRLADRRAAAFRWEPVKGAMGYVVRLGDQPDSLWLHQQVEGETEVTLRFLNADVEYWYAVDCYNDSGYTPGAVHKLCEEERI